MLSTSSALEQKIELDESKIDTATDEVLNDICSSYLNLEVCAPDQKESDKNINLIKYVIDNTQRDSQSGRLIMPALWNQEVNHLLSTNLQLAKSVLQSNLKKYSKDMIKFKQYDQVIKEQLEENIIEPIKDLDKFVRRNEVSFLAHNAVFRSNVESTKCRIVYLSNLCERGAKPNLSHNQCSFPGANLNYKLQTALLLLRFDKFLLTFDIRKAFLQIMLQKKDTNKLLFLWFKNIEKGDFSIVAFKFLRVAFGLRFSPFLLMMALYIILIIDGESDNETTKMIKKTFYNLVYMDNVAFSTNDENEILLAYKQANDIFLEYGFPLQQFHSNSLSFQNSLDSQLGTTTDVETKLLGLIWNREEDELKVRKLYLNPNAKTKREVLQTLNTNFDLFGFCLPLLNRAKLFMHSLQSDALLDWDKTIDKAKLKEWVNIATQINNGKELSIPRSLGRREDAYNLVTFTDASKDFFGCAVYLQNTETGQLSFVLAKNRVISKQHASHSIPVLELIAMHMGVEVMIDCFDQLSGALIPIKINFLYLFTDSTIALTWLKAKVQDFSKIERKSVIINNKLDKIVDLCNTHDIYFNHVSGMTNPADCVTRCLSAKVLKGTKF